MVLFWSFFYTKSFKSLLHVFCSLVFSAHNSSASPIVLLRLKLVTLLNLKSQWTQLQVELQNCNNGFQRPMICSIEHCWLGGYFFTRYSVYKIGKQKQDFQFSKVPPSPIQVRLSVLNCFQRQRYLFSRQYIDYLRAILIMMVISDALSILCWQ